MKNKWIKMMKGLWLGHAVFGIFILMDTILVSAGSYQLSEFAVKLEENLSKEAAAAFGLYVICQLGAVIFEYIANLEQNHLEKEIRLTLRNHMSNQSLSCSLAEYGAKGSQSFLDEQVNSMEIFQQEFLENFYNAIYFALLIACGCIMFSRIYLKLAIAMLAAVMISYVVSHFYDRAVEKVTKVYLAAENHHMAAVMDMMDGFLDIYFNQIRNRFLILAKRESAAYEQAARKYYTQIKGIGIVLYLPMFVADMGILSLIIYGVIKGETSIGALVAYINIGGLILNSSESLFGCIISMKGGMEALPENAFEKDSQTVKEKKEKQDKSGISDPVYEIKGIRFSRDGKEIMAIPSMKIEKGNKLVLTGKNGSGKSTLFKLMLKTLKPQEGTICFLGQDLEKMKEEDIYHQVAYLPQRGYLFQGTVSENIFFDRKVSEEERKQVIQASGLTEFIQRHGMDYGIEAKGKNLSGGEKQRILIARALAQHKQIYLLDEPCAGINPSLAAEIERYFTTNPDWTVVMVSHELHDTSWNHHILNLSE
jgi:ATP-binding cassette subfamily C protein